MPFSVRGIIAADCCAAIADDSGEDDAYCVPARITTGVSECAEVLERNSPKPCLFAKLAGSGRFERFVLINKAAGESPSPFERLSRAFDQQHLDIISGSMK